MSGSRPESHEANKNLCLSGKAGALTALISEAGEKGHWQNNLRNSNSSAKPERKKKNTGFLKQVFRSLSKAFNLCQPAWLCVGHAGGS